MLNIKFLTEELGFVKNIKQNFVDYRLENEEVGKVRIEICNNYLKIQGKDYRFWLDTYFNLMKKILYYAQISKFAADFNLEHKRIKTGKHKEGIYHIQHIHSLHSNLKKWMGRFNSFASKYISNYMQWFK